MSDSDVSAMNEFMAQPDIRVPVPAHTSGEWLVDDDSWCYVGGPHEGTLFGFTIRAHVPSQYGDTQTAVCSGYGGLCDGWATLEQGRANARLMAAAPDLLQFAEAYIHWVEIGATPERHLIEMAKAARDKAVQL